MIQRKNWVIIALVHAATLARSQDPLHYWEYPRRYTWDRSVDQVEVVNYSTNPPKQVVNSIPKARYFVRANGVAWCLTWGDRPSILNTSLDNKWTVIGNFDEDGTIEAFYPLSDDKIFLVGHFTSKNKPSINYYFSVASIKNKQIQIDELIELDSAEHRRFAKLSRFWRFQRTPLVFPFGHSDCAVVSQLSGSVLIINNKGHVRKIIRVYDDVFPDSLEKYEQVIVACQAGSDGSLVIASRTREAVLHTRSYLSINNETKIPHPPELLLENIKLSSVIFPELCWWVISPENYSLKKFISGGAPSMLPDPRNVRESFRFMLDKDDRIEFKGQSNKSESSNRSDHGVGTIDNNN